MLKKNEIKKNNWIESTMQLPDVLTKTRASAKNLLRTLDLNLRPNY